MNWHALKVFLAASLSLAATTEASAGLSDASAGVPNSTRSAPAATKPTSPRRTILPDGVSLEMVAGRPEVSHPMGVDFDHQGRLWVLEWNATPPLESPLQRIGGRCSARIVILTDSDGDGRMETRQIFADRLGLPASILVRGSGVYVGQPDGVIWLQDSDGDGRAERRQTVVRTQPENAGESESGFPGDLLFADRMFANLDTWIYSPRHRLRFRPLPGKPSAWIHEPLIDPRSTIRAHDQIGRLIHADGRLGFHTEPVPYRFLVRNPHHVAGSPGEGDSMHPAEASSPEAESTRPLSSTRSLGLGATRPAPGFYRMGSAVYQGDLLPAQYHGGLFTCDPERGLVRHTDLPPAPEAAGVAPAVDRGIFMSLDEESFTPVQMQNGPDGALYLVDLGDGPMSPSLNRAYRRTEKPVGSVAKHPATGRIFRIASSSRVRENIPRLPQDPSPWELASRFVGNSDFWRDVAQGVLIETPSSKSTRMLEQWVFDHQRLVGNRESTPATVRLRALWTLEGQGRLTGDILRIALEDPDAAVRSAALQITADQPPGPLKEGAMAWVLSRVSAFPRSTHPSLLVCLGAAATPQADDLMQSVLLSSPASDLLEDLVVSGLTGRELRFIRQLITDPRCGPDQNRHGRLVMRLGDCLRISGNLPQIEAALDLASNLSEGDWKRRALLSGLSGPQSAGEVELSSDASHTAPQRPQPQGLIKLRRSPSPEVQEQVRRLAVRYGWSTVP
jgi:glucose/arabinose dehydrogenase